MRVTESRLQHRVQLLARTTGGDFKLDIANGGYKLVAEDGSRDISDRMTVRELYNSVRTALNVLDHVKLCEDQENG